MAKTFHMKQQKTLLAHPLFPLSHTPFRAIHPTLPVHFIFTSTLAPNPAMFSSCFKRMPWAHFPNGPRYYRTPISPILSPIIHELLSNTHKPGLLRPPTDCPGIMQIASLQAFAQQAGRMRMAICPAPRTPHIPCFLLLDIRYTMPAGVSSIIGANPVFFRSPCFLYPLPSPRHNQYIYESFSRQDCRFPESMLYLPVCNMICLKPVLTRQSMEIQEFRTAIDALLARIQTIRDWL